MILASLLASSMAVADETYYGGLSLGRVDVDDINTGNLINITLDSEVLGRLSDSTEGFSYGLAGGVAIGDGALELTYYQFPDFEDFDGVSFDEEVEMLNLAYLWTF